MTFSVLHLVGGFVFSFVTLWCILCISETVVHIKREMGRCSKIVEVGEVDRTRGV